MADLDDFFAKKDKKKGKAKPKFLTPEELVKKLELEREAAVAKPKKPESSATTTTITVPSASCDEIKVASFTTGDANTEEEWDEFAEEQRRDYSGLKIGQLTLNDEDEDSYAEGDEEDVDSDGNINAESVTKHSGGGSGGPWKKVVPAEEVLQIPMEPVEKTSSKVYISPALRHAQANIITPSRLKARNRAAPDITNAEYFPTLGAARPEEQRKKKNEPAFEEVRHGGRVQRVQPTSAAVPTTATNRFQTLDEEDY